MKENFVMRTSKYPESPEAVLQIPNAYQPPGGRNKRRRKPGQRAKREQYWRRPKEETTLGSQGWTVSNVGSQGTSHGSVLKKKGSKSRCT